MHTLTQATPRFLSSGRHSTQSHRGLSLFRYVFTARADGGSASPAQQDFCKACLWQV